MSVILVFLVLFATADDNEAMRIEQSSITKAGVASMARDRVSVRNDLCGTNLEDLSNEVEHPRLDCGREEMSCCSEFQDSLRGISIEFACNIAGWYYVTGCSKGNDTGIEELEDFSYLYVVGLNPVLDGGNCMFDSLARALDAKKFDAPTFDPDLAIEASRLRVLVASLVAKDEVNRMNFFQEASSEQSWKDFKEKFNFNHWNDESFIEWLANDWAHPPKEYGKVAGGTVYYGSRGVLRVLANSLGVKVQVLDLNYHEDGGPVGAGDATFYIRQIGQHFNAVRPRPDTSRIDKCNGITDGEDRKYFSNGGSCTCKKGTVLSHGCPTGENFVPGKRVYSKTTLASFQRSQMTACKCER